MWSQLKWVRSVCKIKCEINLLEKKDISYTYFIVMTSNLNCFSWLRAQVKGRIEKNLTAIFTFDIDAVKRPIALPGFHQKNQDHGPVLNWP